MDDLGSKLSGILSDPQALKQIKELGDMLGLSNTNSNVSNSSVHTNEHAENKGQEKQHDEWRENHQENHQDKSIAMPQGIDMLKAPEMLSMITKFAPLLSQMNREDDTTRLLFALRPFLSQERQKKLDEAGKLIKMMKILPLVKEFGILDSLF